LAKGKPDSSAKGLRALAPWLVGAVPLVPLVALAAAAWRRRDAAPAPRDEPGLSEPAAATPAPPETFDAVEPGRGRLARAPHQIPPKGWKDVLWRTWREVSHDRLTVVAGSVTFYSLLAIFPAIGVFVSLYGIFADVHEMNRQLASLADFLPREVLGIVGDQMARLAGKRPASLSAAFVISLMISLWSANAAMKALFNGLNIAYDEVEKRNFFTLSALTYAFTAGAIFFLTVVVAVLVAAPIYFRGLGWSASSSLWIPLRWLGLALFTTGAFAIVYRYGPCRARARWRWVTWGGVFAAILWLGGSLGFSWYVNHVAHYDVTYGSLGAVIGFMMWIWSSVMVVLIGAELNAEIEHQTAIDSTTGAPLPIGARGAAMADSVGLAFKMTLGQGIAHLYATLKRQATSLARDVLRLPKPAAPAQAKPRAEEKIKAS
jgi:membrane protein